MRISGPAAVGCAALIFAAITTPAGADGRGTGGQPAPRAPLIRSVICAPTKDGPCPVGGALKAGGKAVVRGSNLETARTIVFRGRAGREDDVDSRPLDPHRRRLEAAVPEDARSGPITVVADSGQRARSRRAIRVQRGTQASLPAAPQKAPAEADSYFAGAARRPSFSFDVSRPMQVRVELVREDDGAVVRSWDLAATPGVRSKVAWDGTGTGVRPTGSYRFRVAGGDATSAAMASTEGEGGFAFFDHVFPIRGPHDLGQSPVNAFGGARGHKGQDMFARCGTPLAAARGGVVEYAGFHSAAGNYVVITGDGSRQDYVYMHMLKTPLVRTGQRVLTGQAIGEVGETGRAEGCHLHFELWSAPGWYKGGSAFDPLAALRAWDAYE